MSCARIRVLAIAIPDSNGIRLAGLQNFTAHAGLDMAMDIALLTHEGRHEISESRFWLGGFA